MKWTEEEYQTFMTRRQTQKERAEVSPVSIQNGKPCVDTEAIDDALESKLQGKIETFLRGLGSKCFWFHDRSRGENVAGLPDLLIWLPEGRFVAMELKRKGNKLSEEQRRTIARLLFLGHEVHEVRSFKQAVGIIDGSGKQKQE
jgi:hypothetical protein